MIYNKQKKHHKKRINKIQIVKLKLPIKNKEIQLLFINFFKSHNLQRKTKITNPNNNKRRCSSSSSSRCLRINNKVLNSWQHKIKIGRVGTLAKIVKIREKNQKKKNLKVRIKILDPIINKIKVKKVNKNNP